MIMEALLFSKVFRDICMFLKEQKLLGLCHYLIVDSQSKGKIIIHWNQPKHLKSTKYTILIRTSRPSAIKETHPLDGLDHLSNFIFLDGPAEKVRWIDGWSRFTDWKCKFVHSPFYTCIVYKCMYVEFIILLWIWAYPIDDLQEK